MYISAYGKSDYTTSVSSLNPDLIGGGKSEATLYCSFIKPKPREVQNLNIKKEKSWFKWQYIFLIPLAFVFFGWVIEHFERSKTNKKSKSLRPKQYSDYTTNTENFFEDVWEGRKPLGESFWLYFVVINFIISFVSAFLMEYFDNKIYTFIETSNRITDFSLFQYCNHFIVSPSTFHWMGAWLNNNSKKICIRPENMNPSNNLDFWPNDWIKI